MPVIGQSNEARRADEDVILAYLVKRDEMPERDRFTPRMAARYIIDLLDQARDQRGTGDTEGGLIAAAREADAAWDAWMTDEDGEGQDRMERAIALLREALPDA